MSHDGFHVHGAHEHAVEHQAQSPGLGQTVAIFTAVLSTIGAILSYQGGHTQVEAMLYKNEAVLKKTQASDQWNFYQAKSNKGHLMELAADMTSPTKAAHYRQQAAKYDREKREIKREAERLEQEAREANEKSEQLMAPHNKLAQGMTLIQIAISLASITVLTRRRWLLAIAGVAAIGGVVLWMTTLAA